MNAREKNHWIRKELASWHIPLHYVFIKMFYETMHTPTVKPVVVRLQSCKGVSGTTVANLFPFQAFEQRIMKNSTLLLVSRSD